MKNNFLPILLLSVNLIHAGAQNPKSPAQEQYESCLKTCGMPSCLVTYSHWSDTGREVVKKINDQVCVAAFKNCLAKCRLDYEAAQKQIASK